MATNINTAMAEFMKNLVNLDSEETKLARASRDWLLAQIYNFPITDNTFPTPYRYARYGRYTSHPLCNYGPGGGDDLEPW
jgi:hypothetical protein